MARSRISCSLVSLLLTVWMGATAAGGCSSKSSSPDGARDLVTFDFAFGDLPPGCPPEIGNDQGIGAHCTMGGDECKAQNMNCACDVFLGIQPPENTPCFCTKLSFALCKDVPANHCGQNATCCQYQNSGSLCVPNVCLESPMCPVF